VDEAEMMVRERDLPRAVILALLLVFVILFPITRPDDPDLWYHLSFGRQLWTSGDYPRIDHFLYSYPEEAPPYYHEWLYQAILYPLYRVAGIEGLVAVKSFLIVSAYLSLFFLSLTRRNFYPSIAYLLVAFASGSGRFLIRPEVAGGLALAGIWIALSRPLTRTRILVILALQVIWTNLQWSSVLGLALVAAYAAADLAGRALPIPRGWTTGAGSRRPLAYPLLFGGMLLATLANPNHFRALLEPFLFFFPSDFLLPIPEALPTFQALMREGHPSFLTWHLWALALGALSFLANRKRVNLAHLFTFAGMVLVSLSAERHIFFFSLLAVPIVAGNLDSALAHRFRSPSAWGERAAVVAGACVLITLTLNKITGVTFLMPFPVPYEPLSVSASPFLWPHRAARFLLDNNLPDPIFNNFNSGSYLNWAISPRRVFINGNLIDPRTEAEYHRLRLTPEWWEQFAESRGIATVFLRLVPVIAPPRLVGTLLQHPRWTLVFYDGTAAVLVRDAPEHRPLTEKYRVDLEAELRTTVASILTDGGMGQRGLSIPLWREVSLYQWRQDMARLFRSRAQFYLLANRPDLAHLAVEMAQNLSG
jgi:hypothetical protein